jgi:thioredoxin-dependent peroxiredoxin
MIGVGEGAPDFATTDSRGQPFRLSEHRGRRVLLYFFPKAFTAGCTVETRKFAELAPTLSQGGIEVVGISIDSVDTQRRFAERCGASFPILSDANKSIARSYGVLSLLGVARRVSFLIDENGVVRGSRSSLLPGPHLAWAQEQLGPPSDAPG